MQLRGMPRTILRGSRLTIVELSSHARTRLQALEVWRRTGQWTIASEVFGLSRATLYRWRQRYDPQDLRTLEARSRRPRRVRQPTTPGDVVTRIQTLREQFPRWGREKLRVLLGREGIVLSAKTSDRVLARLKARGVLVEPPRRGISARTRLHPRSYAIRKPKDYPVALPGDLVQVDTLDVRPLPGVLLKHFTARDVIARWDVLAVYRRATATTAAHFLESLQQRMPFPIRALQVDGGSEFHAAFEAACQQHGIRLFVLPPRSPKLNGHVERAQRTHTEEFYEAYEGDIALSALRLALQAWEEVYNTVRPHQALGYLTPREFLTHHLPRGPTSHMS